MKGKVINGAGYQNYQDKKSYTWARHHDLHNIIFHAYTFKFDREFKIILWWPEAIN